MTGKQFSRELEYQLALHFVKQMLQNRLISEADYQRWRSILIEECNPPIGRIDPPAASSPTGRIASDSARGVA